MSGDGMSDTSTVVDASRRRKPVSRVQLALRVADLDAAVDFYSRLFATSPAKRRPGYANFAVAEPPLKLVLLQGEAGEPTRMDHLGVEVPSRDEVTAAAARLAEAGLATRVEDNTTCCYAVQDKVWVTGPGAEPWEVYTVTGDARSDLEGRTDPEVGAVTGDGTCCRPEGSATDARVRAACC
jgi:catechol 2,3-dioxygenase-like lactoylglutathione lyase family enzyme